MIWLAICDDCQEFLLSTRNEINQWSNKPNSINIDIFDNGDALLKAHFENPFDIIILDIIMPLLNGIDAAQEIRKSDKNVKIVFLTSSCEFTIESYHVHASNYWLKPINSEKLYQYLDELYDEIKEIPQYLVVNAGSIVHRILLDDIEYIEAQRKKSTVVLKSGERITAYHPFHYFEEMLLNEKTFFKCHRSYIVNLLYITTYTKNNIKLILGENIPISRSSARFLKIYTLMYYLVIKEILIKKVRKTWLFRFYL